MGDLLALAVVAHGGMQRRDELKTLRTELSVAGSMCGASSSSSGSAHRQDLRDRDACRTAYYHAFTRSESRSLFVPDRLASASAHAGLGVLYMCSNRAELGIVECERARALDQNLATAHGWIGMGKYYIGRG